MRERLRGALVDGLAAGIGMVGLIALFSVVGLWDDRLGAAWMAASFGASVTLLLACPDSPLGRPVPSLVGNVVSAFVGVLCRVTLGSHSALAAAVAVIAAVGLMAALHVRHPPGGASALLAVIGGPVIHDLGWLYPLCPIFVGTGWLLLVAAARKHLLRQVAGMRGAAPTPPSAPTAWRRA